MPLSIYILPMQRQAILEPAEPAEGIHMAIMGTGEAVATVAAGAGAGTATGSASAAQDAAEGSARASLTCMDDVSVGECCEC